MSNYVRLSPLSLRSSNSMAFSILAIAICCFVGGVILVLLGFWTGWIMCILAAPAVLFYRYNPFSTLMITFGGISVNQLGRTSSFMWSDVDEFYVEEERSRKLVVISLSRTAIQRGIENGIYLTRVTDKEGDHRFFIPDNFGHRAEELRDLLRQWRCRLMPRG